MGLISLSKEDVKRCKIGHGADTCIWLVMGAKGFECCYFDRPQVLADRWKRGDTVAKRDGCDEMKSRESGITYNPDVRYLF